MAKDRISKLSLKEMEMINDIFDGKSKITINPEKRNGENKMNKTKDELFAEMEELKGMYDARFILRDFMVYLPNDKVDEMIGWFRRDYDIDSPFEFGTELHIRAEYLVDNYGADKILDSFMRYLSSDDLQELIEWFVRDYEIEL